MSSVPSQRVELSPTRPRDDALRGTWLIWAGMAAISVILITSVSYNAYDPDDLMRLQEVRDLLAGQAWFDVTQYRMNPPDGASMHWSRIVDIPLAALNLLFRVFMPARSAEFWASVTVPLLHLGAALFLLRGIMLRLGLDTRTVLAGLCLAVLFPLLPPAFAPLRIDHHTPQAIAILAGALMLLHAPRPCAAVLGGMVGAASIVISLESLPVVALIAGAYGLRYVVRADRSLAWFLCSLAIFSTLLSFATRPVSEFARWCDILLPAHLAAFGIAAAISLVLPHLPLQQRTAARLAALALIPLATVPVALLTLGPCVAGPFGGLDPLVGEYWYSHVSEAAPVWKQAAPTALPALYTALLVPAGLWAAIAGGRARGEARIGWLLYAVVAFCNAAYGLYLMREMLNAQLLAIPFAAVLFARFMPQARAFPSAAPRIAATLACVMLVTPLFASLVGKGIGNADPDPRRAAQFADWAREGLKPCDIEALNELPQGHVFTSFNAAPTILANTHHSVEMGGYHRNVAGLRGVIEAFILPAASAREIVEARRADYLVACLQDDAFWSFAEGRPDSLAQLLLNEAAPEWLEPVPGYADSLMQVYRVR